jgi:signal transduction histidine kinase
MGVSDFTQTGHAHVDRYRQNGCMVPFSLVGFALVGGALMQRRWPTEVQSLINRTARIFERRSGFVALSFVLLILAMLPIYGPGQMPSDRGAVLGNVLVTLCVAASVYRLRTAAITATTLSLFLLTGGINSSYSVGAFVAVLVLDALVASRHPPKWAFGLGAPFVVNAAAPLRSDREALVMLLLVGSTLIIAQLLQERRLASEFLTATQGSAHQARHETTVLEERTRIARELHDVVAHHISLIAVQAETARLVTPGMPDDGKEQLLAIGDRARTALTDMRRLLGVMRSPDRPEPDLGPQPRISDIPRLIDDARLAASDVTLHFSDSTFTHVPSVDIAAYRIVQEALTNARRHAPSAPVVVNVTGTNEVLDITVSTRSDVTVAFPIVEGHGLTGIRERVNLVGGIVDIGPKPEGFTVHALLPLTSTTTFDMIAS